MICRRGYLGYVTFLLMCADCANGMQGDHSLLCKLKIGAYIFTSLLYAIIMFYRTSTLESYERKLTFGTIV